ncbi:hypothetical protein ACFXTH_026568 [Malus domestica]
MQSLYSESSSPTNSVIQTSRFHLYIVFGRRSVGQVGVLTFLGLHGPRFALPENIIATTDAEAALLGADYCFHAVPVQVNTLRTVSQITPQALKNPREPFIALSVPSFALELMNKLPTAMVVASKDNKLANAAQQLLACDYLRISTSSTSPLKPCLRNIMGVIKPSGPKPIPSTLAGLRRPSESPTWFSRFDRSIRSDPVHLVLPPIPQVQPVRPDPAFDLTGPSDRAQRQSRSEPVDRF